MARLSKEEKARREAEKQRIKEQKQRAKNIQQIANKVKIDIYGTKTSSTKTQGGRQKQSGEITGIEEIYKYLVKAGYNKAAASHPALNQYNKYIKNEEALNLLQPWEGVKAIGGIWQEGKRSKGARAKLTYNEYLDYMESHLTDIHNSATMNSDTGAQESKYSSKNIGKYFINKINQDLKSLGVQDENGEPLQLKGKTIKSVFGAGSKEESEYTKLLNTIPQIDGLSVEEATDIDFKDEDGNPVQGTTKNLLSLYWKSKRFLMEIGKAVGVESDTVVSDLDTELVGSKLGEAVDTLTKRYTPSLNDTIIDTGQPQGIQDIEKAQAQKERTDIKKVDSVPKIGAVKSNIKITRK